MSHPCGVGLLTLISGPCGGAGVGSCSTTANNKTNCVCLSGHTGATDLFIFEAPDGLPFDCTTHEILAKALWIFSAMMNVAIVIYCYGHKRVVCKQMERFKKKKARLPDLPWYRHKPLLSLLVFIPPLLIIGTAFGILKAVHPDEWVIGTDTGATIAYTLIVLPSQINGFFGLPARIKQVYKKTAKHRRVGSIAKSSATRQARAAQLCFALQMASGLLWIGTTLLAQKNAPPIDADGALSFHSTLILISLVLNGLGLFFAGVLHYLVLMRFASLYYDLAQTSMSLLLTRKKGNIVGNALKKMKTLGRGKLLGGAAKSSPLPSAQNSSPAAVAVETTHINNRGQEMKTIGGNRNAGSMFARRVTFVEEEKEEQRMKTSSFLTVREGALEQRAEKNRATIRKLSMASRAIIAHMKGNSRTLSMEMMVSGSCQVLIGTSAFLLGVCPPLWRYSSYFSSIWIILGAIPLAFAMLSMARARESAVRPSPVIPHSNQSGPSPAGRRSVGDRLAMRSTRQSRQLISGLISGTIEPIPAKEATAVETDHDKEAMADGEDKSNSGLRLPTRPMTPP